RMKFVLKKVGIDEFRNLVLGELAQLEFDPRWKSLMDAAEQQEGIQPTLLSGGGADVPHAEPVNAHFLLDNVQPQRQEGYSTVTVNLPLGDLTPTQGRGIAAIARRYCGDDFRTTVEQNIYLRWVKDEELPAVYAQLAQLGLHEA